MADVEGHEPQVAIVGMAGRFPGARNVGELWRNLREGVESLTFWSDEELLAAGVPRALLEDPGYVKACFYLPGQGDFDAGFFGMNPREAELTDPQQRIFLEVAWETLEDAGIDPARCKGSIGVFASASRTHYMSRNLLPNPAVLERMGLMNVLLANEKDFLATRVSYKLDLRGPSVTVATACSSSMVGVHLGAQALLNGECDVVLAGGICLAALQPEGYFQVEGGVFAPDGHVRAFDRRAGGQVGGNGIAVVALKRLEDALRDGDTIRAVLRGSALDNDGLRKVSFSAPGVDGQARVIAEALAVSGVDPETIGYVEAHGTGTALGDPIEVRALTRAWREWTQRSGFCPIGSLKTNIGHLDAGAGTAGLIKAALVLQHGLVPPSLNYEQPNPEIDFEASPFYVNTELAPFARPVVDGREQPRRAAVSSFGMGGTNAHAILEEAPVQAASTPAEGPEVLCLSARSPRALEAATANLAGHLEGQRLALPDVAYTTQVGRHGFRCRRAVVAADRVEAAARLRRPERRFVVEATAREEPAEVAFLFSGQGAQYPNMLRGLRASEPVVRDALERCLALFAEQGLAQLADALFPPTGAEEDAAAALARTELTQPALFAVEWALSQLWLANGLRPAALLGHSIGEYAAACLAGVFTLEDAVRLVAARGRAIGALPAADAGDPSRAGAMLAVSLGEAALAARLASSPGLSIAAVNAPELCVVSGPRDQIASLEAALAGEGLSARRLHTSHAFHSILMDPCLDDFRAVVRAARLAPPELPLVSCTTGQWLTPAEATDPEYWVRHLRQPVRFADGLATLSAPGAPGSERVLLEVGPGETLVGLAGLCLPDQPACATTRHPKDTREDRVVLALARASLWAHGVELNWAAVHGVGQRGAGAAAVVRRRVPLPTYPFEHRRYWIDPPGADAAPQRAPEREADPADWFHVPAWRQAPLPTGTGELGGRWWLLSDGGGAADELAAELRRRGVASLELVRESLGSLDEVRARLARGVPNRIVDLRGLEPVSQGGGRAPLELERAEGRAFWALLSLGQGLAERELAQSVRIDVVTDGLQEILGGELVDPEKALGLGVCKAISAELAGATARSVDVERGSAGLAARLADELTGPGVERAVAWRGEQRWALGHAPLRLSEIEGGRALLRPGGAYLVTGGLGGIGLALAELLAREARAKLLLTSRTGLPDRAAWDAHLAERPSDAAADRIRAVRALETLGAEVLVVAADVADETAMRTALERSRARFGPLAGVIHAAGLPGAGLLSLKDPDEAARVLAPKVRGTQVLERLLADQPLDFLVLCSSLATAVTAVGQVDYFAANAYLDAWAWSERARRPGCQVLSIGWDAWSESGMAVATAVPEALRAGRAEALRLGLSNAEGQDALLRALGARGVAHLYVSTRSLAERIAAHEAELAIADEAAAPAPAADERAGARSGSYPRPELSTPFRAPCTSTEERVAGLWADLLGLERVGADDSFFELGGNSLLLMQLSVRLKTLFDVALPVKALFDTPSVRALAERVDAVRALAGAEGLGDVETEEFAL